MKYSCFLLIFLISQFCLFEVDAQNKDSIKIQHINEVTVTAQVLPSVSRAASPLQVMTFADLERIGVQSISDAVRRFAGVMVKDYGGIGGLKTVSVRGLGDQHTAVLYDGIAFSNSQSGATDIGRFSFENISFISLNIGQADDIFQSAKAFASAGTLNIKTAKPQFGDKKYKGQVLLHGGSWGMFSPAIVQSYKISSAWATTFNGSWQRADGNYPFKFNTGEKTERRNRNNSDVDIWQGELNVYGDLKSGGTLQLKAFYLDSERGIPGAVISGNIEANERLWNKDFFTQINYEKKINSKFSLQGLGKYSRLYSKYLDVDAIYDNGFIIDKYTQVEYYGSASALYKPTDIFSVSLAQDYAYNKLTSNFVKQQYPSRGTSLTALNAQVKTNRLTATAGILGTYIGENVKQGDRPKDKKRLSPAFSLLYNPFDIGLRFRASYKDIYRAPTFNEMYYFRMGNTALRPEISKQYNIGSTFYRSVSEKYSLLNISVDAYLNKVRDKIVIFAAAPQVLKMTNLDNVTIYGVDVSITSEIDLSSSLKLIAIGAYSYQSSENDDTKKQIPYTPKHSGSGSISFENPWVNITYSFVASGKVYSKLDHTKSTRIDAYSDHSVSVNKTFLLKQTKLRLQAEALNLSNKNYEIIQGYPMPGRSFRILAAFTL